MAVFWSIFSFTNSETDDFVLIENWLFDDCIAWTQSNTNHCILIRLIHSRTHSSYVNSFILNDLSGMSWNCQSTESLRCKEQNYAWTWTYLKFGSLNFYCTRTDSQSNIEIHGTGIHSMIWFKWNIRETFVYLFDALRFDVCCLLHRHGNVYGIPLSWRIDG